MLCSLDTFKSRHGNLLADDQAAVVGSMEHPESSLIIDAQDRIRPIRQAEQVDGSLVPA
jgi:hypothetical protein